MKEQNTRVDKFDDTSPLQGFSGESEGGSSQLLDGPHFMGRCSFEPGEMVLTLMSQELGGQRDGEGHNVQSHPPGFQRPGREIFKKHPISLGKSDGLSGARSADMRAGMLLPAYERRREPRREN